MRFSTLGRSTFILGCAALTAACGADESPSAGEARAAQGAPAAFEGQVSVVRYLPMLFSDAPSKILPGGVDDDRVRSEIRIANPNDQPITVRIRWSVPTPTGSEPQIVQVPPLGTYKTNAVFRDHDRGSAVLESTSEFSAFAVIRVVERRNANLTVGIDGYLAAHALSAVNHLPLLHNNNWRFHSLVSIYNGCNDTRSVKVQYSGANARSHDFPIPARSTVFREIMPDDGPSVLGGTVEDTGGKPCLAVASLQKRNLQIAALGQVFPTTKADLPLLHQANHRYFSGVAAQGVDPTAKVKADLDLVGLTPVNEPLTKDIEPGQSVNFTQAIEGARWYGAGTLTFKRMPDTSTPRVPQGVVNVNVMKGVGGGNFNNYTIMERAVSKQVVPFIRTNHSGVFSSVHCISQNPTTEIYVRLRGDNGYAYAPQDFVGTGSFRANIKTTCGDREDLRCIPTTGELEATAFVTSSDPIRCLMNQVDISPSGDVRDGSVASSADPVAAIAEDVVCAGGNNGGYDFCEADFVRDCTVLDPQGQPTCTITNHLQTWCGYRDNLANREQSFIVGTESVPGKCRPAWFDPNRQKVRERLFSPEYPGMRFVERYFPTLDVPAEKAHSLGRETAKMMWSAPDGMSRGLMAAVCQLQGGLTCDRWTPPAEAVASSPLFSPEEYNFWHQATFRTATDPSTLLDFVLTRGAGSGSPRAPGRPIRVRRGELVTGTHVVAPLSFSAHGVEEEIAALGAGSNAPPGLNLSMAAARSSDEEWGLPRYVYLNADTTSVGPAATRESLIRSMREGVTARWTTPGAVTPSQIDMTNVEDRVFVVDTMHPSVRGRFRAPRAVSDNAYLIVRTALPEGASIPTEALASVIFSPGVGERVSYQNPAWSRWIAGYVPDVPHRGLVLSYSKDLNRYGAGMVEFGAPDSIRVAVHGGFDKVSGAPIFVQTDANGNTLQTWSPEELGLKIRTDLKTLELRDPTAFRTAGYDTAPITLVACYAGAVPANGDLAGGQRVANALGRRVLGTDVKVILGRTQESVAEESGLTVFSPRYLDPTDGARRLWKLFVPQ